MTRSRGLRAILATLGLALVLAFASLIVEAPRAAATASPAAVTFIHGTSNYQASTPYGTAFSAGVGRVIVVGLAHVAFGSISASVSDDGLNPYHLVATQSAYFDQWLYVAHVLAPTTTVTVQVAGQAAWVTIAEYANVDYSVFSDFEAGVTASLKTNFRSVSSGDEPANGATMTTFVMFHGTSGNFTVSPGTTRMDSSVASSHLTFADLQSTPVVTDLNMTAAWVGGDWVQLVATYLIPTNQLALVYASSAMSTTTQSGYTLNVGIGVTIDGMANSMVAGDFVLVFATFDSGHFIQSGTESGLAPFTSLGVPILNYWEQIKGTNALAASTSQSFTLTFNTASRYFISTQVWRNARAAPSFSGTWWKTHTGNDATIGNSLLQGGDVSASAVGFIGTGFTTTGKNGVLEAVGTGYASHIVPANVTWGVSFGTSRSVDVMSVIVVTRYPYPPPMQVNTLAPGILLTGAFLNGNVTSVNTSYAFVGFEFSTSANFSTEFHNYSVQTVTTGQNFTWLASPLSLHVTYYYRAWGNSSAGTFVNGSVVAFTMSPGTGWTNPQPDSNGGPPGFGDWLAPLVFFIAMVTVIMLFIAGGKELMDKL